MSNIEVRITKYVEWPEAALRHSSFGVLRFYGSLLVLQAAAGLRKRHSYRYRNRSLPAVADKRCIRPPAGPVRPRYSSAPFVAITPRYQ